MFPANAVVSELDVILRSEGLTEVIDETIDSFSACRSRDYDFVERVGLFSQRNEFEKFEILDMDFLRIESYVGEGNIFRFGRNGEGIRAVAVRDCTGRAAFDIDHNACERRVVGARNHRAGNRLATPREPLAALWMRTCVRKPNIANRIRAETVEQFVRADVFLTDRYDFGQEWFHLVGIGEFQVAL